MHSRLPGICLNSPLDAGIDKFHIVANYDPDLSSNQELRMLYHVSKNIRFAKNFSRVVVLGGLEQRALTSILAHVLHHNAIKRISCHLHKAILDI